MNYTLEIAYVWFSSRGRSYYWLIFLVLLGEEIIAKNITPKNLLPCTLTLMQIYSQFKSLLGPYTSIILYICDSSLQTYIFSFNLSEVIWIKIYLTHFGKFESPAR